MTKSSGAFFRLPKVLFTAGRYLDLSLEAKALYALLLDRADLSAQNGWTGRDGRVFIYFTLEEARRRLGRGRNKAAAAMAELESAGLIFRKRQGQGKPAKIYVEAPVLPEEGGAPREDGTEGSIGDFPAEEVPEEEAQTPGTEDSRLPGTGCQDSPQGDPNHTEQNYPDKRKTDWNKTNPSIPSPLPEAPRGERERRRRVRNQRLDEIDTVKKLLQEQIDYDGLVRDHPENQDVYDGYVELMTDVCCAGDRDVRVCGQVFPAAVVKSRFMKLNRAHIQYVQDCLGKTKAPIGNIRAYILSALYNAPATMEQYYTALVSHDMAGPEEGI